MNSIQKPQYDEDLSTELILWMDNTQEVYNNKQAWSKNYAKKVRKGIFNIEDGITGMKYLVKNTLDSYNKEFGSNIKIDKNDKRPIQINFLSAVLSDIWDNNEDLRAEVEELQNRLKGFF